MTLGIQYKRIKKDTKEEQKNILNCTAGFLSWTTTSNGTKKTKARMLIWTLGKANAKAMPEDSQKKEFPSFSALS